ncbi:putative YrdC-like RNA-binding protein [Crocosphaera subtropica ATCC 51142]|uniref:L-threonylcarbamoyladenylate synthase n=1 Tax=Crocosphaera subtropica (strain ATCC 51142 / BH68) TaxID=43989 RepID=B1WTU7_CROS5|nr:L-threonylcarbamoyladenylate synthase [Crocosphaera subtropica]ACB50413.1 putative YrdC-like RNA-binding protein [Crocosphaera subtropica ATCC 51142]
MYRQQTAQILKANLQIVPTLIDYLEQGEVVLLPTDTVYTLVVNGLKPKAIAKLRKIKKFGQDQPLGILTRGNKAEEVAILNTSAKRMISHFPYPITMIVQAHPQLNREITQGFSKIFLSCPDPFIYDLVEQIPFPLVSATAKVGGEPIVSFDAAQRYFRDIIPLIVDGGRSRYGRRGTLIDFTVEYPTIMNFGPISVDDLRPLLPEIILPSHLMK